MNSVDFYIFVELLVTDSGLERNKKSLRKKRNCFFLIFHISIYKIVFVN